MTKLQPALRHVFEDNLTEIGDKVSISHMPARDTKSRQQSAYAAARLLGIKVEVRTIDGVQWVHRLTPSAELLRLNNDTYTTFDLNDRNDLELIRDCLAMFTPWEDDPHANIKSKVLDALDELVTTIRSELTTRNVG